MYPLGEGEMRGFGQLLMKGGAMYIFILKLLIKEK